MTRLYSENNLKRQNLIDMDGDDHELVYYLAMLYSISAFTGERPLPRGYCVRRRPTLRGAAPYP